MTKKILLFGKNGQLGWELQRSLSIMGDMVALDIESEEFCGDFTDPDRLSNTIQSVKPDIIVNAAAFTAVDKAESAESAAFLLNAETPALLARQANALEALLVHYSTDYVFDGSGEKPWSETDIPSPINVYGRSKLAGENAIQTSGCRHLIFRTSGLYGAHGHNFVKTILRLAKEGSSLRIVNDQIGAPTPADLLADITALVLRTACSSPEIDGLYHVTSGGETSWYAFACYVLKEAERFCDLKVHHSDIVPISSAEYPLPAKRPLNFRLDTRKFTRCFNIHLPHWSKCIERLVPDLIVRHNAGTN
ncbi:MAG: dTDP-4-dehydrorhamnose reductase [Alphaproteobacteria bacterium]|nr:dTDP-4-dehydrorhamnose reductase [Alphaproteobacteria bacterium]